MTFKYFFFAYSMTMFNSSENLFLAWQRGVSLSTSLQLDIPVILNNARTYLRMDSHQILHRLSAPPSV